jgi:hypothetical protein
MDPAGFGSRAAGRAVQVRRSPLESRHNVGAMADSSRSGRTDTAPDAGTGGLDAAVPLSTRGRRLRLATAALVFALITVGTVHGSDDAFPFGPLRMYATRDDPNGSVVQAVVLAISRAGRTRDVTDTSGAPRRAELEGRMGEFMAHPDRFAQVAPSFLPHEKAVGVDPDLRIELVRRRFPLHDGRSGRPVDQVVSVWTVTSP